jgi:hypothetical protein
MTALARVPSFTFRDCLAQFVRVWSRTCELAKAEIGICDDCSEGLVDLVGNRCGQFSHRHHAGHGEILLCLTQLLFGSSLLRHVNTRANITGKRPIRIESWHPDVENSSKFAVVPSEAILHRECLSAIKGMSVRVQASLQVLRMNPLRPAIA